MNVSKVTPLYHKSPSYARNASIIAHVWNTEKPYVKELRFNFFSCMDDTQIIKKLMAAFGKDTYRENPVTGQLVAEMDKCAIELIKGKCAHLNVRWIRFDT